jgi:membrane associated rhomboid family serine protease
VDCVAEGSKGVRQARTTFGGSLRSRDNVVTKTVIAICVVMYGAQFVLPASLYGYLPLYNYPGFYENAFAAGNWWQPITSAFLHSPSPLHLLFNMYALWIVGQYLEPLLGRSRFVALYLISALGGAVGATLLPGTTDTAVVGASGAVFGLFAALFVVNRHLGRQTTQILVLIGINFVIGFAVGGISWQAHLGGLVTGAVLATVLARGRRGNAALQWGGVAAVAVIVVGALAYAALRMTV